MGPETVVVFLVLGIVIGVAGLLLWQAWQARRARRRFLTGIERVLSRHGIPVTVHDAAPPARLFDSRPEFRAAPDSVPEDFRDIRPE